MFRDEKLELKVGLFIGIGMFIMFLIVFSIKDISLFGKGYEFAVVFDFINGVTESAPIRLSGVTVGEVKHIDLYFDDTLEKTRVKLNIWIRGGVNIEKDSVVRINTLGLLGEQYLEISPGKVREYVKSGDILYGHNPMNVGEQMEGMNELLSSMKTVVGAVAGGKGTLGKLVMDDTFYEDLKAVFGQLKEGEGTLGKLLMEDTLYGDLSTIFGRLRNGEGTIGKLLVEENIYNDMEAFVADLKANPWKLLSRPKGEGRKRK